MLSKHDMKGIVFISLLVSLITAGCGEIGGYSGKSVVGTWIAGGLGHTCIAQSTQAWCWGYNGYGQLGNGTTKGSSIPVLVLELSGTITAIAAGSHHSCIVVDGAAKCWGKNNSGQLGDGTTTDSLVPIEVPSLTSGATYIAAGDDETCAVVNNVVKCWGAGTLTPTDVTGWTENVTQVVVGYAHKCAIINGAAQCVGTNTYGQLGNNTTTNSSTPVQVSGLSESVTKITVGYAHSCAVHNGSAKCWGYNSSGQLGDGSFSNSSTPVQVSNLSSDVTDIVAGGVGLPVFGGSIQGSHNCALVSGGVKCWGSNNYGQLGNNSTTYSSTPVDVTDLTSGISSIGAGGSASLGSHSCAVSALSVQCWGWNAFGQLGNGLNSDSLVPTGVEPP